MSADGFDTVTLVLALAATDGVALVSDGQATAGKGALLTRTPARKLGALHNKIAYGCAGTAGLRQRVIRRLEESVEASDCGKPIAELRPILHAAVNDVQHDASREFVRRDLVTRPEGIEVLFAGVSDAGQPWIYEITADGEDEEHSKAEAIGTGAFYAKYALISAEHYRLHERGLAQVRVLAYRAVNDAIRTAATDLGTPISLFTVTSAGAFEITGAELESVSNAVTVWQAHEREIFPQIGGEGPGAGVEGTRASPPGRTGTASGSGLEPPQPA